MSSSGIVNSLRTLVVIYAGGEVLNRDQRMNKLPLLLLGLLLGACTVLHGQSFDLTTGRVPVASLDGLWRFHTGDNPAWADPNFDDSSWPLLRSDKRRSSQGYANYKGIAWFRFQVTVPAELEHVSVYLPVFTRSYEVYADGRLIGTYGKVLSNTDPGGSGGDFRIYPLPVGKRSNGKIQVALRSEGSPQHGGGLVGETKQIELRDDLDRASYFRSLASTEIMALLLGLAGLGSLALFLLRRKDTEYFWISAFWLICAAKSCMLLAQPNFVWNSELFSAINSIGVACANFAELAFFLRLLRPKRTWLLNLAVASIAIQLLNSLIGSVFGSVLAYSLDNAIFTLSDFIVNAWTVVVALQCARQKSIDARLLVVPLALGTFVELMANGAITTYTLGWQHGFDGTVMIAERPFPITLPDVSGAFVMLAMFGILILRFARTRSQEERFAAEVQAAREIQQYLIPAHMPFTPGLIIESEYRPAREVGGDFFQVLPSAEDGSVLLVLGDVAGKGLHAGMLATLIVGAIRTAAKFTTDPEKILELLNERLQGRGLVTCLALLIERGGNVTLANAGHLPPYLNEREMPMDGALPLGAIPGVEFSVMHFQLAEGDSLMLMSDGVAEAQDARGRLFGFERIGAMLSEGATAASLAIAAQNFGQEDDITVLTVARLAPAMIG